MKAHQELQNTVIAWQESPPGAALEPTRFGTQVKGVAHSSVAQFYQPFQQWPRKPATRQLVVILKENLEQQVSEFAKQESLLNKVRQYYVLADSSALDFLSAHRAIPQILLDAVPPLKESFGANAVFSLRAPDDDGGRILYAVIMWPGKLSDVRDGFLGFDDWWVIRSPQAAARLVFTYELV